jgi:hypothetical protein
MGLTSSSKLGTELGAFKQRQLDTQRELSPQDSAGLVRYEEVFVGSVILNGEISVYKWEYKDDSFILDNPVQGEIDSPVYKIDGGYTDSSPVLLESKSLL